jgi:hypothetical protein
MAARKTIEERFWIKVDEVKKIVGAGVPQRKKRRRKLTYGVIGTDRNASAQVLLAQCFLGSRMGQYRKAVYRPYLSGIVNGPPCMNAILRTRLL